MADEKRPQGAVAPDTPEMSQEEAQAQMDRFFQVLEERVKDVPEAELERGVRKVEDFIDGKMGWAELFNFTPEMLFQMAEFGFMQFKQGRYPDAERVFKALTLLDFNNAYYHSVMGSILQRQKRYGEAIAEYTQARELNRGEIFMRHGLNDDAAGDFQKAIDADPEGTDRFANRARMLSQQLARMKTKAKG